MTTHPSLYHVPYVRRRNTPAQLSALQQLFEATPRPTRAQRRALANEIGMELKSVTSWFQNRRQTSRKRPLSYSENDPPQKHLPTGPVHHRHSRSQTLLDRSKVSLDRIAALSERPSSQRLPLTPHKSDVQRKNPSELWTHMLSSPAAPPSAPDLEEARLAVLSSQAKTLCPLEWACLKARQNKWVDEDEGVLDVNNLAPGAVLFPQSDALGLNRKSVPFSLPDMVPQLEDVEAAITLLGFKTRT